VSEYNPADIEVITTHVDKLAASPVFAQTDRLVRFLRYIVEEVLEDRGEQVNQYALAMELYNRDESFDPATDSIVRVDAGRLRTKLREYYDVHGRNDQVRFALPKGQYAPRIQINRRGQINSNDSLDDRSPVAIEPNLQFVNRPAIAVLPFDNLSADPEQEYFVDGLTEDIITSLSHFRWCPIIGRHSTFAYKGTGADLQTVSSELGARYIVEGSARRIGDQVRINAQLIDATENLHLWAERSDHLLQDIFAAQDEIARQIVTSIAPEFRHAEIERTIKKQPSDLSAWELVNRGLWHLNKHNREDLELAQGLFEKALELDPIYGAPLAWLSVCNIFAINRGWVSETKESLNQAYVWAREAVVLEPRDADFRRQLAVCLVYQKQFDEAIEEAQEAIKLNPSSVEAYYCLGLAMCFSGRPSDALEAYDTCLWLSPVGLYLGVILSTISLVHLLLRDFEGAARVARRAIRADPNAPRSYHRLAIALASLNNNEGATDALVNANTLLPDLSVEFLEATHPFKKPEDFAFILDGLRMAGWRNN
jgi:adenylate cyclase